MDYTCITCRVRFNVEGDADSQQAAELQKRHFQSDWHRYNLKRKIAELAPVSADVFAEKLLAQKAQQVDVEKSSSCYCAACGKKFSSSKSYDNHLNSKKHRDAEIKLNSQSEVERMNEKNRKNTALAAASNKHSNVEGATDQAGSAASCSGIGSKEKTGQMEVDEELSEEEVSDEDWEGEPLGIEECFFCQCVSSSMEKNLEHMTLHHSFFIPDLDYVTDLEGLVAYLGQKVGQFHMCLWCNEKGKVFMETKSVQQHMTSKGHCKVMHEGDSILEYSDFYDYRHSYPDYKETDDVDEHVATEGEKGGDDDEDDVSQSELNMSGYQLVLPSGATVGHRSLLIYYKQKLKPDRRVILHKNSSALSRVVAQYKALGWTGTTGIAAQQKAKDIAFMDRIKSGQFMKLGVRANKLQRHFRDQNFGF